MKSLVDFMNSRDYEMWDPLDQASYGHYQFSLPSILRSKWEGFSTLNYILIKNWYPLTIIRDSDRQKYLDALRAVNEKGSIYFLQFVTKCVLQTLSAYTMRMKNRINEMQINQLVR